MQLMGETACPRHSEKSHVGGLEQGRLRQLWLGEMLVMLMTGMRTGTTMKMRMVETMKGKTIG